MADKRDYYEVLGVSKGATDDELKKAFRQAAKTCHPDLHPGDPEAEKKFKEVNEAYSVLSDKEKRQRYDQFGHAGVDPSYGAGGAGGYGGYNTYSTGDFGDIFGDIFGDFFGGSRGRRSNNNGPVRGKDISARATISFKESVTGCKRTIRYRREENCSTCNGSGAKNGGVKTCTRCGGSGQVTTQQRTMFGAFSSVSPCPDCSGTGKIISDPCPDCSGKGSLYKDRTIEVSVVAGISTGQSIKLAGQGGAGKRGGSNGDLYVEVTVDKHKLFQRQGNDVVYDVPITISQAATGCTLELPTVDGDKVIQSIPEGTQHQAVFKIKNKGIPYINGRGRGDMYIRVLVEVPKGLSKKEKEMIAQLDKILTEKNYSSVKKYSETIKDL